MSEVYWTEEKKNWIRSHAKGTPRAELLAMYNEHFHDDCKLARFSGMMSKYKITNGLNTQFKKDHIPYNKGKNIHEYMSEESIARSCKGRFKQHTGYKPGQVYIKSKHGKPQAFIKLDWGWHHDMLYSRYVWEHTTGEKLSSYDYIIHLDGDYTNCDFNNLMKVGKEEHLRMISKDGGGGYDYRSADLNKAKILTNNLMLAINKKAKGVKCESK